ncbi:hypothetical protein DQ237_03655 [Blastococcus sp. TF02-8]|uniref:cupredoxin domain-containing protein n=1 Tax=Blastococcus sp. TF02-8 TaxID=2250574 RepID=UPI000DE9EA48|nr:cupredoxin domain-containing protein [Blastococcus sp. TF02-8]RBY98001.1 hypothetical protein DQ237_03655 [Blastococcus sp. TF02-8]
MAVRTPLRALAGAALLLTVLTACGGDPGTGADEASVSTASPSSAAASSSAADASEAEQVAVTAVDFAFRLDEDGFRPGTYAFTLTNEGGATHDLVVERDGKDVAASDGIRPGQSTTVTATLEPGEYVLYCSIGNHRAMGMEVTVQVA